jgi:endonuclease/exonuclease/phosphatase family metal-dependent hydrolase
MLKTIATVLKTVCLCVGILVAAFLLLLAALTVAEYKPEASVTLSEIHAGAGGKVSAGQNLKLLSWNIGYAGLGENEDFFMDGGKMVRPKKPAVTENMRGISDWTAATLRFGADFVLMQEVDQKSRRSYGMNQVRELASLSPGAAYFAANFRTLFVPYPVPPIGSVDSGLLTLNGFAVSGAERVRLPSPFKWPVRVANLKRCLLVERLLVERLPVENSSQVLGEELGQELGQELGKELVLVNLHLEAYSSNEGRLAQMKILNGILEAEYAKGNYVIAGGDFNQTFPGAGELYSIKNDAYFVPGALSDDMLPAGFRFAGGMNVPTSRLNNKPYSGSYDDTQLYAIDGFILAPNVELISVATIDLQFKHSDHNPVAIEVRLLP